jgi:uncharacterized repeat protein (TIGR03803 family)
LARDVPAQAQETLLHSFAGKKDGEFPTQSLTDVNGVLYGVTNSTVFKITTSGTKTVLYTFAGGSDGIGPEAALTDVSGVPYGTTCCGGGSNNDGTVFKITPSGAETVLYRFAGGTDGANPEGALSNVNGMLYGTTFAGGGDGCLRGAGCGTVYKVTASGTESVLYRFAGGTDGANPKAALTNVNGVLYGTTYNGGDSNNDGTVFEITTSGAESVLHTFGAGNDGSKPLAGLINVNGVLYGTTEFGGAVKAGYRNGTVFKVTTSGTENVLHSFGGGSDGVFPYAGLTNVNGVLYGTTDSGGDSNRNGTVFKITTSGVKSSVYQFDSNDGSEPQAALTQLKGLLYGTTFSGGANGVGTVFSLSL